MVLEFKYLGRVITDSDDDWKTVVGNLRMVQKRWAWMSIILGQEESDPQTSRNFYKAVVQANLLFGAETCVMYPQIGSTLGGFHHRMYRCLEKVHMSRDATGR